MKNNYEQLIKNAKQALKRSNRVKAFTGGIVQGLKKEDYVIN